jgi:hypothetical protein
MLVEPGVQEGLVPEEIAPRGTCGLLVLRDNHELLAESAVRWAVGALVEGYDVPSLRVLAGLDLTGWPNSFEAEALVEAALHELGIPEMDRGTRARLYVREISAAIIARELGPSEGVDLIHRRVITPLEHPADLQPWCYLWEGNSADCSGTLEDSERDAAILDYAALYLRTGTK